MQTLADAIITETYEEMSQKAAEYVLEAIHGKPDGVICVATGASPLGVYAELAQHAEDLKQVRVLKLDEWGGLPMDDPSTCEVYIEKHVLTPWNVTRDRYEGFRSDAPDAEAECQRIHQRIQELGGIDIAILGMGEDGHIGLNYPDDWIPALAHPTDSCALKHAMLKAAQSAPTHGLTLGMVEILSARRIILVVNGANKAEAVELLMSQKLSTYFPASFLWMHKEVFFVLDRPATLYT
ncbi:MAG TPA: 6-phosphogluconolactonase [Candidatus Hydrogenedentes bacterium]|nr:6-phosphogluconolactonase [Candidatus Hydrogenedentota bacterium]